MLVIVSVMIIRLLAISLPVLFASCPAKHLWRPSLGNWVVVDADPEEISFVAAGSSGAGPLYLATRSRQCASAVAPDEALQLYRSTESMVEKYGSLFNVSTAAGSSRTCFCIEARDEVVRCLRIDGLLESEGSVALMEAEGPPGYGALLREVRDNLPSDLLELHDFLRHLEVSNQHCERKDFDRNYWQDILDACSSFPELN